MKRRDASGLSIGDSVYLIYTFNGHFLTCDMDRAQAAINAALQDPANLPLSLHRVLPVELRDSPWDLSFQLDAQDEAEARAIAFYVPPGRQLPRSAFARSLTGWLTFLACCLGLFFALNTRSHPTPSSFPPHHLWNVIGFAILATGVGLFVLSASLLARSARPQPASPVRCVFTPDLIEERRDTTHFKVGWELYDRCIETPNLFVLDGGVSYRAYPKRFFASAEELQRFRQFLRQRLPSAGCFQ